MKKVFYFAAAAVITISMASCGESISDTGIDTIVDEAKETLQEGAESIKEKGQDVIDEVKATGEEALEKVQEEGQDIVDAAKEKGAEVAEEAEGAVNDLKKEVKM